MKLPQISGKDVIKKLCKTGFIIMRQKGSHVRLEKGMIKITVPLHSKLKKGTLYHVLKEAEISLEEFENI